MFLDTCFLSRSVYNRAHAHTYTTCLQSDDSDDSDDDEGEDGEMEVESSRKSSSKGDKSECFIHCI